jgi:predicted secreted protein
MENARMNPIRRFVILTATAAAVAVIWSADGSAAKAQTTLNSSFGIPASQQINNPVVSPYLTLAVNPQIQIGNAVAAQQLQIGALQQATAPSRATPQATGPVILETGHVTAFMNTMGYFPMPNIRH